MRTILVFLFLCSGLTLFCLSKSDVKVDNITWQNGDIILTSSGGTQGEAVKAATNSEWTHTAVIYLKDGQPMVLEAVQPVQTLSLQKYLNRYGKNRKHSFMRLKDPSKLKPEFIAKANTWASKHLGKNYDGRFQWSDKTMYCSELVWKIYDEAADIQLCKIRQVKDYDLKHPKVAALIKNRFGSIDRLKLDEKIVAPSDIADSELLEVIEVDKL